MHYINDLIDGAKLADTASTPKYRPGSRYIDGNECEYIYGKANGYISGFMTVELISCVAGTTFGVKKAATTSTTIACGATLTDVADGYYGFFQERGPGKAYVASSAVGMLQNNTTAGTLKALTSNIAACVAQTIQTGQGLGTTTNVYFRF